jgi:diaminopimelate epimerase
MIKFTKMEGLGNDYVYMDAINQKIENRSELARFVSNRNLGIGSDGLILIEKSEVADFKMTMFNSDGSQAEMCGNGIRCVAKFVYDKGMTDKTTLKIETLAGIKILELNVEDGKVKTVRVDMGEPILEAEKIPVISTEKPVKNLILKAQDKEFRFTCVSMGNPHAITIVDDTESFDVKKYGEELEVNKAFPRRANVEFVQIVDKNTIKMRVWERGAGETLACGTGACATAVACNLNGLTDRKVTIKLLGGNLKIEWNAENNHVYMTGPATTVFEGELVKQGGTL